VLLPSMAANRGQDDTHNAAMMQQWLGDFRAIFNQQQEQQPASPQSQQTAQSTAAAQQ